MPFCSIFTAESGRIPFPKNLSIPKLPNADNAPLARCGATFDTPFVTNGAKEIREDQRLPPCFTAFLICVFDILISAPVFFVLLFVVY